MTPCLDFSSATSSATRPRSREAKAFPSIVRAVIRLPPPSTLLFDCRCRTRRDPHGSGLHGFIQSDFRRSVGHPIGPSPPTGNRSRVRMVTGIQFCAATREPPSCTLRLMGPVRLRRNEQFDAVALPYRSFSLDPRGNSPPIRRRRLEPLAETGHVGLNLPCRQVAG